MANSCFQGVVKVLGLNVAFASEKYTLGRATMGETVGSLCQKVAWVPKSQWWNI
jgi:hypothetical protein